MKNIARCAFVLLLLASRADAQTPPCTTAAHAGASYENCASGVCEKMVCDGSAYAPLQRWTTTGTGTLDFGNDSSTCDASRSGRLRYTGSSWDYCNGTAWTISGIGGATAGGSDGQVQFNNSTAFAGSPNFVWDNTNRRLHIKSALPASDHYLMSGEACCGRIFGLYVAASGNEGGLAADSRLLLKSGGGGVLINANGTALFIINSAYGAQIWDGSSRRIAFGNALTDTMTLLNYIEAANSSTSALRVRGVASQTANLQEWQNSTGSAISAVDANGRVNINTTAQAAKLTVGTTVGGDDALILRDLTNNANARFYFTNPVGTPPDLNIAADRIFLRGNEILINGGLSNIDGTRILKAGSGTVTIGRSSTINLQSDLADTIFLQGGSNKDTIIRGYNNIYNVQLVPSGGNVGIGTTSPAAKLDVNGSIKIGTDSSTCDAAAGGKTRYNSTAKVMEYCNETAWTAM